MSYFGTQRMMMHRDVASFGLCFVLCPYFFRGRLKGTKEKTSDILGNFMKEMKIGEFCCLYLALKFYLYLFVFFLA